MKRTILTTLASGVALLGIVTAADAKFLSLKVISGGSPAQITSTTFAGPSQSITQANTINDVTYSATGSTVSNNHLINLTLDTTSKNNVNTVRNVLYALTLTGLIAPPGITDWQDLFSGVDPVSLIPLPHTLSDAEVHVFYDPQNHAFAGGGPGSTATLLYSSGGFPLGCGIPPSYSCTGNGPISLTGPFSLTEFLTINYKQGSAGQTVVSNNVFGAVPEPTSLAILGTGLLLAAWMVRRRRNVGMS